LFTLSIIDCHFTSEVTETLAIGMVKVTHSVCYLQSGMRLAELMGVGTTSGCSSVSKMPLTVL